MLGRHGSGVDELDTLCELPAATRRELDRLGDRVELAPGELLARAGDPAHWVWVVLDGNLASGHRHQSELEHGAGSWLGVEEALTHSLMSSTVWATEPTTLLAIGVRQFCWALDELPMLASRVLRAEAAAAQLSGRSTAAPRCARGSRAA